jgi:acetyl-CoA synthetase
MSQHDDFVAELIAERHMSLDDFWKTAEARLDWPISKGLNTAHEACDRWARDRARLALILIHPDGRREPWTFAELSRASNQLATAWLSAGLRRGDRVAGLVGQQSEAFIAALAAWRAGLVYMPLFAGFGASGLASRLEGGAPAAIVVDHRYRGALAGALSLLDSDPKIYTVTGPAGHGVVRGDFSFWAELDRHGADTEVAVVGATDPARGTVVRAVVVPSGPAPEHELADELRDAVREKLGRHAYPRVIDFVKELPKTETGKIRRNVLRDQARSA